MWFGRYSAAVVERYSSFTTCWVVSSEGHVSNEWSQTLNTWFGNGKVFPGWNIKYTQNCSAQTHFYALFNSESHFIGCFMQPAPRWVTKIVKLIECFAVKETREIFSLYSTVTRVNDTKTQDFISPWLSSFSHIVTISTQIMLKQETLVAPDRFTWLIDRPAVRPQSGLSEDIILFLCCLSLFQSSTI